MLLEDLFSNAAVEMHLKLLVEVLVIFKAPNNDRHEVWEDFCTDGTLMSKEPHIPYSAEVFPSL